MDVARKVGMEAEGEGVTNSAALRFKNPRFLIFSYTENYRFPTPSRSNPSRHNARKITSQGDDFSVRRGVF